MVALDPLREPSFRRVPRVFEESAQWRDFVPVPDVAPANRLALALLELSPGLRAYNVASQAPGAVGDMAAALPACDGLAPAVTGQFGLSDLRHVVADPGPAACALGCHAAMTLAKNLRDFAAAPLRVPADSPP